MLRGVHNLIIARKFYSLIFYDMEKEHSLYKNGGITQKDKELYFSI